MDRVQNTCMMGAYLKSLMYGCETLVFAGPSERENTLKVRGNVRLNIMKIAKKSLYIYLLLCTEKF